jgi:hypothetical protein
MVVFNLLMSVLVGVYFDVVLHRIVLRQHPDLYPLPIFLQVCARQELSVSDTKD